MFRTASAASEAVNIGLSPFNEAASLADGIAPHPRNMLSPNKFAHYAAPLRG